MNIGNVFLSAREFAAGSIRQELGGDAISYFMYGNGYKDPLNDVLPLEVATYRDQISQREKQSLGKSHLEDFFLVSLSHKQALSGNGCQPLRSLSSSSQSW